MVGEAQPVLYRGKPVMYNGVPLIRYMKDTRLLIAPLKAYNPERFRDRVETVVKWDGNPDNLTMDQRDELMKWLRKQAFGDDEQAANLFENRVISQLSAGQVIDITGESRQAT